MVTFDQSDGDVLVYISVAPAPATGMVTAAGAGVVSVEITFVNALTGGSTTAGASLDCTPDRTFCTWHVNPRLFPGLFSMSAIAEDAAGNSTKAVGPSVFLIGTGQVPV